MEKAVLASNSNKIPNVIFPPAKAAEIPARLVLEPTRGWRSLQLLRLWQYRELLYFMVWREIKVRYKQTVLGVLWIVVQPVVNMLIFTLIFGWLLKVPADGAPYPVFAYAALLPWQYFASSLTRSSTGLVDNAQLITKIYFPRLIIPLAGVLSGLVDLAVAFIVLVGLMLFYHIPPTPALVFIPGLILVTALTALGFGLWLAALNVRYRDVKYLVPFLVQVWMYATPVIYSASIVPERFRWVLSLNPMTGVVEGFRWALLSQQMSGVTPPGLGFAVGIGLTVIVFISGVVFFRATERTFADIV